MQRVRMLTVKLMRARMMRDRMQREVSMMREQWKMSAWYLPREMFARHLPALKPANMSGNSTTTTLMETCPLS
ncbi:hypothetical protein PBY51_023780 [Eleginops maclovinus]|uniref:Uncharacterized protein n=1 Tax=Eleginops maclovinus TaxID=56733 RepID=A0AAN7WUG4_ELEMC|nr:hypothetical protein PBY51_023780 [Eleginops maclovinus]